MDLKEPKKKRTGPHIRHQQHFPILVESECGLTVADELWPLYIGSFVGDCVMVQNPDENISLYTMGFFGKGSLSKNYPSFELTKKGIPPILKERQWQRRRCWMEKLRKSSENNLNTGNDSKMQEEEITSEKRSSEITLINQASADKSMNIDKSDNESITENIVQNKEPKIIIEEMEDSIDNKSFKGTSIFSISDSKSCDKVLVLADSDDEDIEKVLRDPQSHLEEEPVKTVVETLNLTLEEAFFLSYALGCLQVIDMFEKPMTLLQLWHSFCEVKSDFIESYIVYHYFRAKGWIVKSGQKFGGDFLLYKQGPPFFHASYVVLVEKVDNQLKREKNSLTWTKLHGLNRLAETSGKEIIICQVVFPKNFTDTKSGSPKDFPDFQAAIMKWRKISELKQDCVTPRYIGHFCKNCNLNRFSSFSVIEWQTDTTSFCNFRDE